MKFKKNHASWNKGKKMSEAFRKNVSAGHLGQKAWNKAIPIIKECIVCKKKFTSNPARMKKKETKYCSYKCYWGSKIGLKLSEEHKEKIAKSGRELFSNKEYREKRMKKMFIGMENRPTSLEKQMISFIKKHNLPYKYVGDGDFWIGHKNPDFININGEKKLIEVGCEYFKKKSDGSVENYIKNRSRHFEKYGWKSYFLILDKLNESNIDSFFNLLKLNGEEVNL